MTETADGPSGPATALGRAHATRRGRDDRFRPDIEGLRAIAVLAVVLFHAGVGFLSGGFVGVDVFYVISGFLITDHLWREIRATSRLSFARFFARRARRLLPAAIVVLLATTVASASLLPPLQLRSVWKDGFFSALYVGNFRFAATQTNYLANAAPSPFQHYWSLGVEEQFYVVWPLLLVAASLVWWIRKPSKGTALTVLIAISIGSFILSIVLTRSDQPVSFFLLPSRTWELGLGGIIALCTPRLRQVTEAWRVLLGWLGLLAIAVACIAYGSDTAYPGDAALLPVAGAGAVIVSGLSGAAYGPVLILGRSAMTIMGRLSYSWYLWHYPVLILAPYVVGHPLSVWANVGLVAASGVLAVVTYRFVEIPGRRARWWAARPTRSLSIGLALSAAGALACLGVALTIPTLRGHGLAPVAAIHRSLHSARGFSNSSSSAIPPNPTLAGFDSAQAQVVTAVKASASASQVPANLDPPLFEAAASEAAPMVDGCLISYTASTVPSCLFGDTTATRSIVLFGDSHAAMWFPAVEAWANANSYRLYVWTKAACPPVDITLFSPVLDRTWTECSQWYGNIIAQIKVDRPSLVVLGIAPNYDAAYDVVQNGPAWQAGLASTLTAVRKAGSRALVMGSVPGPLLNVPDCLSANLDDMSACNFSPIGRRVSGGGLVGIDQSGDAAEAKTVSSNGGLYANASPWFCTATVCDVVVDNLLVYRDDSHITLPYAQYLAPLVGDEMTLALSDSP